MTVDLDHVYVTPKVSITTDVNDFYYTDYDMSYVQFVYDLQNVIKHV